MSAVIKYFWIAEYNDGQALPQFDPMSGKENMFSEIDMDKLVSFGWYPFSHEFAFKSCIANNKNFLDRANNGTMIRFDVTDGKKIVAVRRQSIDYTMTGGANIKNRRVVYVTGYDGGPYAFFDPDKNTIIVSHDFNLV